MAEAFEADSTATPTFPTLSSSTASASCSLEELESDDNMKAADLYVLPVPRRGAAVEDDLEAEISEMRRRDLRFFFFDVESVESAGGGETGAAT